MEHLSVGNPDLPPGHPFTNVLSLGSEHYWTATLEASVPGLTWVVSFGAAAAFIVFAPGEDFRAWCVR